jgi:hypothetical protein
MKKNILILNTVIGATLVAVVGLGFVTEPTALSAATSGVGKIINPLGGTTTFSQVLNIVISTVQVIAGILSVVYIILAGLSFVMANGDPAKITKARTMLLYVVIGVAIIFGAQAISIVVQTTIKQVGSGQ